MNLNSLNIAFNIMFKRPTIVLGKFPQFEVADAINFLDEDYVILNIRMLKDHYYDDGYLVDFKRPTLIDKVQSLIESNPNRILIYSAIESADPSWQVHMLQQVVEGRRVLMVGQECPCLPLFNRCDIVRL